MSRRHLFVITSLALSWAGACSGSSENRPGTGSVGSGGTSVGAAGATAGGGGVGGSNAGAAGTGSDTSGGNGGATGAAGSGAGGGDSGNGGTAGVAGGGAGGAPGGGAGTGGSGTTGTAGATGSGGAGDTDPPAPRPLNITGSGTFSSSFNGQPMYVNKDKTPMLGKLLIYLGGIGGGPGSGGIDAFAHKYGFHNFMPATNTSLTGDKVPGMYKAYLTDNDPTNDREANRQVGDARTDLWDGKGRVTWNTVGAGKSILEETIAAIHYGEQMDPGGDWGYYLNTDGTLRTSDVWVVGYSWGSQTWSMVSTYIRFGRVIVTSGPVNEGWPNGTWMTDPSATPLDRKFALVSDGQATDIFPNVQKAGWLGSIVMVQTTSTGPYSATQHLFEMVGGNGGITPGGHTVFCNDNPMNGWTPVCTYVFGQQP
jgi:hypothetical protein